MADYTALQQAVISGKVAQVKELTQKALSEAGRPGGPGPGPDSAMDIVARSSPARVLHPEMLIAARAMQAGIGLLKPMLVKR